MKGLPLLAAFFLLCCSMNAAAQGRLAVVMTVAGPIDPISARYVMRGLDRARRDSADIAIIELDTPGGLGSSMDQIVAKILASPVPVAVYVTPSGARAASAGVFIAMAAHVAAMAPGTHIGAAHPVDSSGADIKGAMGEKILNDTLAKLRSLAVMRNRPADWADDAVRRSLSLTETEAVARRVADLSASSLGELLSRMDGRRVSLQSGEVTLRTAGAEVRRFRMTFMDWILAFLVNPDVAYILLVIGVFGLIFELTSPGAVAPGVVGAIALLMAFIGFGNLPTNIGGIVFIALAIGLFLIDLKTPTHGLLTAGGVVAFVLGSFLLFPPWRGAAGGPAGAAPGIAPGYPPAAGVGISLMAIIVMTILVVAFFVFVLGKGIGAQARKVTFGVEALAGGAGTAVTDLAPEGLVHVGGEQWSARSEAGGIKSGERVEVVGRDGLRLIVRRSTR
jgi:membrane-bound serine protease (ClpP class)